MQRLGLFGETLGHSWSEIIHTMFFEITGISGVYHLIEVPRERFCHAAESVRVMGFRGMNVTIPYKEAILSQLDAIDPLAQKIGAVNTIVNDEGSLTGYNTDVAGFRSMLARGRIAVEGISAAILGASGGAAQAAIEALLSGGVRSLYLVSRRPHATAADARISWITYEQLPDISGQLLVNCTPIGMFPNSGISPVDAAVIRRFDALADMIYNPMETLFLQTGRKQGKPTVNGLFMLVSQAMAAQRLWQNRNFDEEITEEIFTRLSNLMQKEA